MKHRKLTAILAAALMLSSCGQTASAAPVPDLLAQIQAKGEIVIATEGTWAPWTYHDEADRLVGYDVEVARLVAEKLGVRATFVEGEWDGLLAGVTSGRYDIMANGVEITGERAETFDFSAPYAYIRTAVIVNSSNDSIRTLEDLSGKQTANTLASTYAALAESFGATAVGVDDLNQTIELLLAGRVDATLNAEVTYYDYMKAHPDAKLKIAALTEEAARVAFPVRKGADSQTLLAAVSSALAELEKSGELTEISMKYFGKDISRAAAQTPQTPQTREVAITIQVGGKSFAATLYDNPSAHAFAARLPLTLDMQDVNGNEKAYFFSESLPTDAVRPGQIRAGDLMLYGTDCLVLFYESFSSTYSYTRLGALDDATGLADALGAGDVQVNIFTQK